MAQVNVAIENQFERSLHIFPPPSYAACNVRHHISPPPSYDSLFGRSRNIQQQNGACSFSRRLPCLILASVGWMIILSVTSLLPVVALVLGLTNKDNCQQEPNIPMYLIVFGVMGICQCCILTAGVVLKKPCIQCVGERSWRKFDHWRRIVSCCAMACLFIWFICGNVWVYRNYDGYYDNQSKNYYKFTLDCDKVVYLFAFWLICVTYLVVFLLCCCGCVLTVDDS